MRSRMTEGRSARRTKQGVVHWNEIESGADCREIAVEVMLRDVVGDGFGQVRGESAGGELLANLGGRNGKRDTL
jgi:hypothetical protein